MNIPKMRPWLFVEWDFSSNLTSRRTRPFVEFSSTDNSSNGHLSKFRRKFVEIWSKMRNAKMKVTYQNSAMRMRLEVTGVIGYTTKKMWCYGSPKKGKRLNRKKWLLLHQFDVLYTQAQILLFSLVSVVNVVCYPTRVLLHRPLRMVLADSLDFLIHLLHLKNNET